VNKSYDEIINIEETTMHVQIKMAKCWHIPGMKLAVIKERGASITLIGDISDKRRLVHSYITKQRKDTVQALPHWPQKNLQRQYSGRGLRLPSNLQLRLLNAVYDANFKELFLPPYNSKVNQIKRL
jgi:hypothetical protein